MADYEIVLKDVEPQRVASLRQIKPTYGHVAEMFGEIMPFLGASGVQFAGPPLALYHDEEYKESDVDIEVAVPIVGETPEHEHIRTRELPGGTMAAAVHRGPFEGVHGAYEALMKWIEANGYEIAGPSREVYLTDPDEVADPSQNVTEVQIPVTRG
ncbi:MAG: GyrI-like domain-containing protein [Armatimonadota bacterium]|nr:GyrI-like domain-containing protein [Armatimonadota bacterium]